MRSGVTRQGLLGALAVVAVLGVSLAASFGAARAWRGDPSPRERRIPYTDGRHLVAFVIVSSECGFCADRQTKDAISKLRTSLKAYERNPFAKVTVIGVTIDTDLAKGFDYLTEHSRASPAFDEISVGSGWENHFVTQLIWREGFGDAATPEVLLVSRSVDASRFPGAIQVTADSLVLRVPGRDSLIAWVKAGTPLPGGPRRASRRASP